MQKKQLTAAITMVLFLTVTIALPFASGQEYTRESLTWVSVYPDPVGYGQNIYVVGWVYPMPSPMGAVYEDLTFTVTRPDGTIFTRTMDSSVEGTLGFNYNPDQVGEWSVKLTFPGDLVRYYASPSESPTYKFTVQEEPIPYADESALPTGRWTWPISLVNREWFRISGSWPKHLSDGSTSTNYYSPAPESPHIIWRKPWMNGGLFGGSQGHEGIVRPDQGGQWPGFMVAARGRLYYKSERIRTSTGSSSIPTSEVTDQDRVPIIVCVDQYTGEKVWETELPTINYTTGQSVASARNGGSTLQIVELSIAKGVSATGVNQPGMGNSGDFALWASGGGLWKIDPLTGQIIWYQLQPTLSPTYYDGAWYIANYPTQGNYSCISANSDYNHGFPPMAAGFGVFQTVDDVTIWRRNMTTSGIPSNARVVEGYLVQTQSNSAGELKLNTWDAKTGNLVANGTFGGYWASSASNPSYGSGVYSRLGGDGKTYAWSFKTGSLAWVSEVDSEQLPWATFGNYQGSAGFGYVIAASYAPYKYCYDATTGDLVWKQYTGTDNPYNYQYPTHAPGTWGVAVLADNKVYWASGEHTPGTPSEQGDMLYCNDLATGELLWRLPYFKGGRQFYSSGVSDGYLFYFNQYDGCEYMIGKGETKTTVSALPSVGSGTRLIQGRVIDISPGTSELPNWPDGVPAVSDESQSDFMAILYTLGTAGPLADMSKVTGVPVVIDVIDENGNYRNIGTTTSDASGFYSFAWEPDISGKYTVIASFDGGKSYYPSFAETAFTEVEAEVTPTPTPMPTSMTDTYVLGIGAAAIVAIIVIGLIIILMLRKR